MLRKRLHIAVISLIVALAAISTGAQTASQSSGERPVLWENVSISDRDLYAGPGGGLKPDLSKIEFIKEEKGGHNKKYRIRDGSGVEWVAKLGREAQPETAAVRLLWGLGYRTEINFLIPSLAIPGKGTFKNVRLEARPENVKRLEEWKWASNPFTGTDQLQALKIMMVFMTNWDLLDLQNKVLRVKGKNGTELQYVVSDLGATFGKLGNNNLPIIYRLGRKTSSPKHWQKAGFVKRVKDGNLEFAFKGKGRKMMRGITVEQGRWLADRLLQLSDSQLRDAFRAANYSAGDAEILTNAARRRINELDRFTSGSRYAEKR